MSYRPIMDNWFCVRAKLKGGVQYYGSYPAGFLERARALLGVHIDDPVLHVCGGYAHLYPYYGGYGPNDARLDLNHLTKPEYVGDVRIATDYPTEYLYDDEQGTRVSGPWGAMLADPPYSEPDATHYPPGSSLYPSPRLILRNMLSCVEPGRRVAILHYVSPRPPANIPVRLIAKINVSLGYDNRDRTYTVYEKLDMRLVKRSKLTLAKPSLF